MRLTYKFGVIFLVILLLFGAASYISYGNIWMMQNSFKSLDEYHNPVIDSLNDMDLSALRVVSSTLEYSYIVQTAENMPSGNNVIEAQTRAELKLISDGKEYFSNALEKYDELINQSSPEEQEYAHIIGKDWAAFVNQSDNFIALQGTAASREELIDAKERFEASEDALFESIDAAIEMENDEIQETKEGMNEIVSDAVKSTWIAFAVLAAIALISISTVSYSIKKPIERLRMAAADIGRGNLNTAIDISSEDEIGDLAGTFNKMAADLKRSRSEILLKTKESDESKLALESRVKELTETKRAMLNMMEDAEEANKELSVTHKELQKNISELNEADIKKNEFMSIAAHELKTPMTSIHGFSQLLQNPAVANDLEKRNKYLSIMEHETNRLANLVNDVLDLSRVDLNATTFDITRVDVGAVIETVRTELAVQMKQKGLEAKYDIDKNLPAIMTDRERLTQILMNLINNAIKYTPKGKIHVGVFVDGKDIHFIVSDTGIGISKENQKKIFTRFYQVDSSYTRSAGGVGLGLSLCKEFVVLLGGKIWFTSTTGKGSDFHFTLPTAPRQKHKK